MQKVTKAQNDIIETTLKKYKGDKAKAAMHFAPHSNVSIELFTRCMIEGYEVFETKEDQVRELYRTAVYPTRFNMIRLLNILDIKIKGVNDNDDSEQD
jgi:hypothetical protein